MRWQIVLCGSLLLAALAGKITRAELTEEEKKDLFLKSREKMRAVASQTTTVDTIRLAVLAALNIADEFHVLQQGKSGAVVDFSKRAKTLARVLDEVLEPTRRAG